MQADVTLLSVKASIGQCFRGELHCQPSSLHRTAQRRKSCTVGWHEPTTQAQPWLSKPGVL